MVYSLNLLDFDQIGVLRVALSQRRRAVRRQRIDTRAAIDTIAVHIGIMPGPLAHRRHAGHDARGHLGRDPQLAAGVEYAHHIAVLDPAFFGVQRI